MIIPFNCNEVKVTSKFGYRTINGKSDNHKGYDLVGIGSKDVIAAVGGTIIQSRIITDKSNITWQWGNYVCIKTDTNQLHYYCHLDSRCVEKGQKVNAGDKIGVMGNTGYSFGAHLHFEARESNNKTKLNPEKILGIPNNVGTYGKIPSTQSDLNILIERGVINSPDYWINKSKEVKYLPELIHFVAEYLK